MDIKDFLEQNFSNYLFKDLDSLALVESSTEDDGGAVSFPMLMTTISGIELLGALLRSTGSVKTTNGNVEMRDNHFIHFWTKYLIIHNDKYTGFENLFYQLMRNGLAHTFMVKHGIYVYKDNVQHLRFNPQEPCLIIGCIQFAEDFKNAYQDIIPAIVERGEEINVDNIVINQAHMQKNLDDLLNLYAKESEDIFNHLRLPKKISKKSSPFTMTSGASLSTIRSEQLKTFTTPSGILSNPEDEN